MRVRKFEYLKVLWDKFQGECSANYVERRNTDIISMVIRTTHCIRSRLYPECEKCYDTHIDECGDFINYEELDGEVNPFFSHFVSDILWWFNKSLYWSVDYGIYGTDGVYEDGNCDGLSPAESAAASLGLFGDDELMSEDNDLYFHMREWYDFYEGTGPFSGQGYALIVSYLYPYVAELKKHSCAEDAEMLCYLDKAFDLLSEWIVNGPGEYCDTKMAGYFLCQGGNTYDDGFSTDCNNLGLCDYYYNILIAGEMIESIVFALDEKYSVLPAELKRKEE